MTHEFKVTMYYSLNGAELNAGHINEEYVEQAPALIRLYTEVEHAGYTTLSVVYPIKKGDFFNADAYCIFMNEKEEQLNIGRTSCFGIQLRRDLQDYERLHVILVEQKYKGQPHWLPAAGI
jgi:hypothetical protein